MSDGLDIQNLLQTGYFATSRAKNGRPTTPEGREAALPSQPKPAQNKHVTNLAMRLGSSQVRPPPPSVEDEEVSLAREHGSPVPTKAEDENVQSRGDAEQFPVLMEVHEHNPERRFVIVDNTPPNSLEGDEKLDHRSPKDSKATTSRPSTPGSEPPIRSPSRTIPPAVGEPAPRRPEYRRRKSGQELPPLETEWEDKRRTEHHRTMSAASAQPSEYFSPRQSSRFQQGNLLSPDIIQHGSARRERAYHGYGQPQSAIDTSHSRRGHSTVPEDRRRDGGGQRRSPSPVAGKRSSSNVESVKPRRRMSNDPGRDSKFREGYISAPVSKERPKEASTADGRTSQMPAYKARDDIRPAEEPISTTQASAPRRPKSIVVQEGNPEAARKPANNTDAGGRDTGATKTMSMPLPSPKKNGNPASDQTSNLRSSATFPTYADERKNARQRSETSTANSVGEEGRNARPKTPTKPVEFVDMPRPRLAPSGPRPNPSAAPTTRNERPSAGAAGQSGAKIAGSSPVPSSMPSSQETGRTWQPPSFDPEKDGMRPERPVGSYRRFSEGRDASGPPEFPECPRTKPVAGKMDWLTLPRTDFNICPTCYRSVFSESQYRTEFQPILRPTDKMIACDFGSSPWYRIAWLMTWHKKASDLRLFHQIANVATTPKAQSCPGNKKSTRNWYTIWDPYDRRPIEDFPVCYQCFKTVETLLPSLSGVFAPLDSRSEPSWRTCELHFTPARQRFVMYYDILERAAEKAASKNQKPNVGELAKDIEKLSSTSECREDSPISDGHWHVMQYLPQFTVCGDCFDDVVRPKLEDRNVVACNFLTAQKKLPAAACQLYSRRMREIFAKSCRRNDPSYLEAKVKERLQIEADIHAKLVKLDSRADDAWAEEQVSQLIQEWKRWE